MTCMRRKCHPDKLACTCAHLWPRMQKNREAEDYAQLLQQRKAELRERRSESLAKKRAARIASQVSASSQ